MRHEVFGLVGRSLGDLTFQVHEALRQSPGWTIESLGVVYVSDAGMPYQCVLVIRLREG